MDAPGGSPTAKKSKNGKVAFTPEIEAECVSACSAGFTIEKCAGLIGVPIGTLKTWTNRFPDFARKLETARKKHELSLLRDIELAGQKSWQAKAWLAERVYQHAIPSARLQVSGSVDHNAGAGFAQLIAGLASRRAEKKAQAQIVDIDSDIKQIKNNSTNYSESIICKDKTSKNNHNLLTNQQGLYNNYCATNEVNDNSQVVNNQQNNFQSKTRHVRMKRRKPRSKSIDTTTPPADPPAPV